jgi:hypothetical protein
MKWGRGGSTSRNSSAWRKRMDGTQLMRASVLRLGVDIEPARLGSTELELAR